MWLPAGKFVPLRKPAFGLAFLLMIFVSAFLRWEAAQHREVHADEAENLYQLASGLDGDGYEFDAKHHHGPTLNRFLNAHASLFQERNWTHWDVSDFRVAIATVSIVTLVLILLLEGSVFVGLFAATVAGTSMVLSYYGGYIIHETLLGCFALVVLVAAYSYAQKRHWISIVLMGCFLGLMLATKLTSLIYLFSWGIAGGGLLVHKSVRQALGFSHFRDLFYMGCTAAMVAIFVYSNGFVDWEAVLDAVKSPFIYQVESGHSKPWNYFVTELLLPKVDSPYWSHDSLLILTSVIGGILCLYNCRKPHPQTIYLFGAFLFVSAITQLAIYSVISYKTPWLVLTTWLQLAMVGGIGLTCLFHAISNQWGKGSFIVILSLAIFLQTHATYRLLTRYHSDHRNPLAYVPTSSSVRNLESFLDRDYEGKTVNIYGKTMWPIPWYLRNRDWRYEAEPSQIDATEGLKIISGEIYGLFERELSVSYEFYPYTLRQNEVVYLCLPRNSQSIQDD
jgi:predicted membrane-bound mannosyltransferase